MLAAVMEKRAHVLAELVAARKESAALFSALKPSYLYDRPIAERHRVIFYIGHLDAFDFIQICREGLGETSHSPTLDALFQAGIDPDSNALPTDTAADWPTLEQTNRYVIETRQAVDRAIESAPQEAVYRALEHRLMHLETLAYMWHNFDYKAKTGPSIQPVEANCGAPQANDWLHIPNGTAILGKPKNESFGWDNEYNEHEVPVSAFRIQRFKVTNGEYLEFVREGARTPHFWTQRNGKLYLRLMFEEIPLPLDWPVYVTQKEALAYAAWTGKSLPTEAQFHGAAFGSARNEPRRYPWGEANPAPLFGNFDFRRWDPEAVHSTPADASAFGVRQLVGNGWEWTVTPFMPFQGFAATQSYPGYSANFFDGAHYVMKGGSPRTAARLLRKSFRNWFRPDYPYVYGAFRCVEN